MSVPSAFRSWGSTGSAANGEAPPAGRGPRPKAKPQDGSSGNLGGPVLSTCRSRNGMPDYPKAPAPLADLRQRGALRRTRTDR